MVGSELMRGLDERVVGFLVDSECLVRLLDPSFSVGQTGLLFLAIGGAL